MTFCNMGFTDIFYIYIAFHINKNLLDIGRHLHTTVT